MWLNYLLGIFSVISAGAAIFCWRLYTDAIQREIATTEVLCGVLLSPMLHQEFQQSAYDIIQSRFSSKDAAPSQVEVISLANDLMTALGNASLQFIKAAVSGITLQRILTGPFVVGRNREELWRFARPADHEDNGSPGQAR